MPKAEPFMGWVVKTVLPREIQKLASTIEWKDTTTTLHIEHRTQLAFKSQREHIATVNTPNIAYPGQYFKMIIPKGSADHVIVPDTVKMTFDLELTSTDK